MWQKCRTFVRGVMAFSIRSNRSCLRRRHGELHARERNLVAPDALVPRRQHAGVVLLGRDDLVARLEVDAVLKNLQRLARVARNRELLGVAAELGGEPPANRFEVPVDQPGIVDRRHVLHVEVALDGVGDHARMRTVIPGIEIDDRAIERERLLDLAPVVFVARNLGGRLPVNRGGRREDVLEAFGFERDRRRAQHAGGAQERSSGPHGGPPQTKSSEIWNLGICNLHPESGNREI